MSYLFSSEQEIKNDVGNPIPIAILDSTGAANSAAHPVYVSADISSTTVQTVTTNNNLDAFGRLRVSEPTTLGDYYHISGENPEMLTVTTGGGFGVADVATSSYILSVGSGSTDRCVHQSRMYHHYLPGKSQLIKCSFVFGAPRTNTLKSTGYFDDRNGVFVEQAGDGSLRIVERSFITGAPVDIITPQAQWNRDTCSKLIAGTGVMPDGSAAPNAGKVGSWTLDATKDQLMVIDFQWLGVGRIRISFVHDGELVLAHEIMHSNYIANPYWTQPSLPVRCEIRNTGPTTGTASLKQICATVICEGGYIETGISKSINSSLLGRTIQNGGDTLPIVAIRLKNTINGDLVRGIVRARDVQLLVKDGPVFFELRRFDSHTSVSGGSWVSAAADSIIEYNITATGYTGGETVDGSFLAASAAKGTTTIGGMTDISSNKRGFITQNYYSTDSQCYALVATALDSSNNIAIKAYGSLQWTETR